MEISKAKLQNEIEKLMVAHPSYGVRRIHETLKKSVDGPVSIKRVRKLMRELEGPDESKQNEDKENSTMHINVERVEEGNILKQRLRNKPRKALIDNQNDEDDENDEDGDSDFVPEGKDVDKLDAVEKLLEEDEELMHESFVNELKLEIADTPVSTKNILNSRRKTKNNDPFPEVNFAHAELEDQDELYVPSESEDDNEEESPGLENKDLKETSDEIEKDLNDAVDNLKAMIGSFKTEQQVYASETKKAIAAAVPEKKPSNFYNQAHMGASPVPEKHKRRGSSLIKLLSEQEELKQKLKKIQESKIEASAEVNATPEQPVISDPGLPDSLCQTQNVEDKLESGESNKADDEESEVNMDAKTKLEASEGYDIKKQDSKVSTINQGVSSPLPSPPKLAKSEEESALVETQNVAAPKEHQEEIQNIMEHVDINSQTAIETEDRVDSFRFWCFGFCNII